jgi:N-acetylglucosamine-6-sulfatase
MPDPTGKGDAVRRWMLVLVPIVASCVTSTSSAQTEPTEPPNIVIVLTDDMRADLLDDMPNVQRLLVEHGRSFERAFIVDPVCCPSRVSFLRGQYAHTTSVFDLDGPWGGWGQMRRAELERSTIATWLTDTHYTAFVGKYMNGYNQASVIPPGWDRWRAMMKPGYSAGTWTMSRQGQKVTPSGYSTTVLSDEAVAAVEASGSEPVFLWAGFYAPHAPATVEQRFANETAACGDVDYRTSPSFNEAGTDRTVTDGLTGMRDKARWLSSKSAWSSSKSLTEGRTIPLRACRSLLSVDAGVARIVSALEEKDPGLENTVIVFTSDQGIQWGEHNWTQKRVPYEGTIRVPFVVRADGLLPGAGSTDRANLILNIDLAPTLVDIVGTSATPGCPTTEPFASACNARGGSFDGRTFLPLLTDPVAASPGFSDRAFLIEMYDDDGFPTYCAVRTPDAKLIRYVRTAGPDYEGYDLSGAYGRADPHELHSVVHSNSDGVARFRANGAELYADLYPLLRDLCDPRPPTYPAV